MEIWKNQAVNQDRSSEEAAREKEKDQQESVREYGQMTLTSREGPRIHLLSIIGEIEGHDNLSSSVKTTKYEHVLPQLAALEDSPEEDGLLVLLNTIGGDVEAGLAIAEMIASLSKPTVSLVLGGSHSIGVPLAVASDYSFIVETGTMLLHPVRTNGMVLGVPQTYDYFKRIQDRITGFIAEHSRISIKRLEELMLASGNLSKDMGTILVGEEAVKEGLIHETGGIKEALGKLKAMLRENGESC